MCRRVGQEVIRGTFPLLGGGVLGFGACAYLFGISTIIRPVVLAILALIIGATLAYGRGMDRVHGYRRKEEQRSFTTLP